jgi:cobalamin biosynthesis protein CobT
MGTPEIEIAGDTTADEEDEEDEEEEEEEEHVDQEDAVDATKEEGPASRAERSDRGECASKIGEGCGEWTSDSTCASRERSPFSLSELGRVYARGWDETALICASEHAAELRE